MESRTGRIGSNESNRRKVIIATEEDMPIRIRPDCPYCGGRVTSNGVCWLCVECGKQVIKKRTGHNVKITDRPTCPECGHSHVVSRGTYWNCCECGKHWVKKPRRIDTKSCRE